MSSKERLPLEGRSAGAIPVAETSPLRILFADDDPQMRDIIRQVFARFNHEVVTAPDGENAWELFRAERFDLVVSDIMMPGINGVELLGKIRSIDPQMEVVLITAFADTHLVIEALRLGASNFIEKPFRPKTLICELEPSFFRIEMARERSRLACELEKEQRRREVEGRMATMGRLLAGLAHELHNPLTFLKGNVEIVRLLSARFEKAAASCDDETRELAENIGQLVTDMEMGVERIRELAGVLRKFGAKPAAESKPVELGAVMADSLKLAEPRKGAGTRVRMEAIDKRVQISASSVGMQSCFVNLLVNAFEALEADGGSVTITTELHPFETDDYDGFVEVSVADDGPGWPVGLGDQVLTPFVSGKDEGMGMGLGLSIAYDAAKANGAQLERLPTEGGGATVRVRMPYKMR